MTADNSVARRLGRVLETVTRQSSRIGETPEFGSWILGRVSESQRKRRIRIQLILTAFAVTANLLGIGVSLLVVTVLFPTPSVFDSQVLWITFVLAPAYIGAALVIGVVWATNRVISKVRWSLEGRPPTIADQRNTFFAPNTLTIVLLFLWGFGTALLTTAYGVVDTNYIPKFLLGISFPGIVVSVSCHLFTEFALRPVAAQALEAGPPPVRLAPGIMGVRAAMNRVEQGDLDTNLVVFDGTELGQLQRGFNSMVHGLRERERVRDLFGRHVGREVAALAEQERPVLGGEERHAAVVFVDIIGSTQLVTSRPAVEVVDLLNRFFAVIVNEVDHHHGLVNKFEGDAVLAVFGAPVHLERAEDEALAAARVIAHRLRAEVPELDAGIGVAAGQVVAGNVGAQERFEYTVIGGPVNEAARLCELSKSVPGHVVAASDTIVNASETERRRWSLGETVTLRGLDEPTRLAVPV